AAEALRGAPDAGRSPETHIGPVVEDIRARLLADEGRWEEAIVATEACAAWERHFGVRYGGWMAWRALAAQCHAALGDQERATAQRAFVCGIILEGDDLSELKELLRTAGVATVGELVQHRDKPHPNLYLGPGKVAEVKAQLKRADANLVVTDDELTPRQQRNL